ncbi:MAG: hypothetical protein GW808_06635 [Sphingomonadales bacterium]|nr:hypothetical protein [Sphingomonadales bacterium]PIX66742.1 MAG: hypothetical protein COZ43_05085 [Sphingomonadales bacterium CG_4_10_14_3_um_filter_58_15]NCO49003.1 hypothetical protein [Sphingomonadales bacterium]NCP00423.1 hypothetical protein [Sphingomonadales bacterium]NCP26075.1 hypothetical protein [Sphingomonadales bacterium]
MSKADRLDRLDARRSALEEDYEATLLDALRTTAAGKWGLFDHKGDRGTRAAIAPTINELQEMGEEIDAAREILFMPPFELQQQFLASRGPVGPQAVGEPKQAQAWLNRLAVTVDDKSS